LRRAVALHDPYVLPPDLPIPEDDGACNHLLGMVVPDVVLPATTGEETDIADLASDLAVVFVYPRTGVPGQEPLPGWDAVPGARGCTPQACGFRDLFSELEGLGAAVAGVSTQSTEEQREFAARAELPYPLLSDTGLALAEALRLPTFELEGMVFYRRVTLVLSRGGIAKVFYPVFPPDRNAAEVVEWLRSRHLQ
jgi:peroxiredoxin